MKGDLKQKIIDTAWDLFLTKGYRETTVNEIIEKVGTSKGGFFYYFPTKDNLLNSLYVMFDREYEKFYTNMDKTQNTIKQLEQISQCVCHFIDSNVPYDLLAELYISQLKKKEYNDFLSPDRYYFKLVRSIVEEGQQKGEIRVDHSSQELAHSILLLERGILIDWCVSAGNFTLGSTGSSYFQLYTEFLKA